jgi:hypothetical protein
MSIARWAKIAFGLALLYPALSATHVFAADLAVLHNGFSIRHDHREVLGETTRLYLDAGTASYVDVPTAEISSFEKDLTPLLAPPAAPKALGEVISSASGRQSIDPDLVNSVIRAESGFNTRAVSRKGAMGLMQLMPQTASRLGVRDAYDAQDNVEAGTRYLRELLDRYNYDLIKALAAYNAGPQRVEQYHGVPPYSETQAYVARIVRDFNRKKLAEKRAGTQPSPTTTDRAHDRADAGRQP